MTHLSLPTGPLQFPADKDWWVDRQLIPYVPIEQTGEPVRPVLVDGLFHGMAESKHWYALLAPPGAGKTSLLNFLVWRIRTDLAGSLYAFLPVDLGGDEFTRLDDLDQFFLALATRLSADLGAAGLPDHPFVPPGEPAAWFAHWLGTLPLPAKKRVLLCLDNFHALPKDIAYQLAIQLKSLQNEYSHMLCCLLADDYGLDLGRNEISPLRGLFYENTYTLKDLEPYDIFYLLDQASAAGLGVFKGEVAQQLHHLTNGYPAMFWQLLGKYLELSEDPVRIQTARRALVNEGIKWLESSLEGLIGRYTQGYADAQRALQILVRMAGEEKVTERDSTDSAAAEILNLKGIARSVNGEFIWNSPLVGSYFQCKRSYLEEFTERAFSQKIFMGNRLHGIGEVRVSLVFDLGIFMPQIERRRLNHLRGSPEYREALQALYQALSQKQLPSFRQECTQQDELREVANELGIFRPEIAQAVFAPVYMRKDNVPLPAAIQEFYSDPASQAELNMEWNRKNTTLSIQLTPLGLVHVRIRRKVTVETSLQDIWMLSAKTRLSVQWEMALQLVSLFIQEAFDRVREGEHQYLLPKAARQHLDKALRFWSNNPWYPDQATPADLLARAPDPKAKEAIWVRNPLTLRERYVTYVFSKLCDQSQCSSSSGGLITWQKLSGAILDGDENGKHGNNRDETAEDTDSQYVEEIAGLLEGACIQQPDAPAPSFPPKKRREARSYLDKDISSWETELCMLTQDNAVISYLPLTTCTQAPGVEDNPAALLPAAQAAAVQYAGSQYAGSQYAEPALNGNEYYRCKICLRYFPRPSNRRIKIYQETRLSDEQYWGCILSGLEYLLELRLLARSVAERSTDDLRFIAALSSREARRPLVPIEHRIYIRHQHSELRRRVITNTRLLAELRDVTTPIFLAHSDYATRKFEHFIKTSNIEQTVLNAEKDIQAANEYLQHIDSQVTQQHDSNMSCLFSFLALMVSILVIPSYLADFATILSAEKNNFLDTFAWLITTVIAVRALYVVAIGIALGVVIALIAWANQKINFSTLYYEFGLPSMRKLRQRLGSSSARASRPRQP